VTPEPSAIVDFWFRELEPRHWFKGSKKLDAMMRQRFGACIERALLGEFDAWTASPRGRLALILLLDQFTRNIYRGLPGAFTGDAKAQALVLEGLAAKADEALTLSERQFFYMPLMHAEDRGLQALAAKKFNEILGEAKSIVDFQKAHRALIERFGRFPTRNAALGRASTPEEQAFLTRSKTR
jgi:uncharacterized protein (DUF924 family)